MAPFGTEGPDRSRRGTGGKGQGPQRLSLALGELIAFRGYARASGDAQLQSAWADAASTAMA